LLEAASNPRYLPAKPQFPAGLASVIVCFGRFPGSLADGSDGGDDYDAKADNLAGWENKDLGGGISSWAPDRNQIGFGKHFVL